MTAPAWARHLPAGADPAGVDLLAAGSLPAAWAAGWTAAPGRAVLHDPEEGWIRAAEFEARSARVAARLAAAGLRPGDRVVFSAGPSVRFAVAHAAALRLGLVVVPVNGAYRRREVAHVVRDARPAAAVVDDAERGRWIAEEGAGAGPAARDVLVVDPAVDLPDGPAPLLDAALPSDPGVLAYTSGTTGHPKGAVLTHANLLASAAAVALAWRWTADDRLVLALPLFHMHGLGVGLHGTLLAGGSAVLLPGFDVDGVLDAAAAYRATLFFGVPTMYARLGRSPRLGELRALRCCVSGSAPLPAALHRAVAAGSGQAVLERYGMTETLMNVSNPYEGERRPGTVGFPLPGVDVRLDAEDGEIFVRGPNVFPGYWQDDAATRAAFTPDGWFRTGDLGARDADGYLRIAGRAKELIITGGYNVHPREVEDVLRGYPGVADVAVAGTPSDEWGEVVTAFVVPAEPPDPDALLAFAARELAPYKRPRLVRYVDALPRNALGKVLRHELR